jgi:tetratricopeptide (TPR) repeat protein
MRAIVVYTAVGAAFFLQLAQVQAAPVDDATIRVQEQALGLARAGDHERALVLLEKLLERYPGYFPLQRDYIIVASLAKDCRRVLAQNQKLTPDQKLDAQVTVPAARCIRQQNRVRAAIVLLEQSLAHNPDSPDLVAELNEARAELENQPLTAETGLETRASEIGSQEWRLEGIVYGEVGDRLHAYSRLLLVRADDTLPTGDVNRAFGGLEYVFGRSSFTGELSADLIRPEETGVAGIVRHRPNDHWALVAGYYTFSEDIPLRAKALNITSDQIHVGLDYHSDAYVWEWTAAANAFSYSDANQRRDWYSELGYAFDLQDDHEQRAIFEASQSSNTLASTVYYNPLSAVSLIGGYKYIWIGKTRFKRRVNRVYVWTGIYDQRNYGTNTIYGLSYRQDYEFDDVSALSWNISWSSKVYDGTREGGLSAGIRYKKVLQ